MQAFSKLLDAAFADVDIAPAELPRLDLYMDQILTLFDEGLSANKRSPEEKLLTKTMINNYSKEHLILPVKGKKYSREQLIQLLCILNLKQTLSLSDLKTLLEQESEAVNFEKAYEKSLEMKQRLKQVLPALLIQTLESSSDSSDSENRLALTLALSSGATYFRRVCEELIDDAKAKKKSVSKNSLKND